MRKERTTWIPVEASGITEEKAQELEIGDIDAGELTHFTPEFVDTKVQDLNVKTVLKEVYLGQRNFQEARISQPEATVKIKTDKPVTTFFVGDVHFGSMYTDHKKFMDDMQKIEDHPNAFVCFMSNLIDNAIPSQFPDGMLSNPIPPDKQVVSMRKIVQNLDKKGKVIAAVTSPCHEGWTYKKTGQDVNALIFGFEGRNFPVLENGGRVNLDVGKQRYKINLFHQVGPFESNFNETHALRQMNRLNLNMEADVVVGAHKHNASAQQSFEGVNRKPVVYIRSGTYKGTGKINDQWAIGKYGPGGAEPSGQSVTMFPEKKKMIPSLELDAGMDMHDAFFLTRAIKKLKEKLGKK